MKMINDPWANANVQNTTNVQPAKTPWPEQQAVVDNANPLAKYDSMGRDEVLLAWLKMQQALASAKADEMAMRKYVVSREFPTPKEGVNTLPLGNGYELKAGVKFNYKLTGTNEQIEAVLDTIALTGNEGSFIAAQIITWAPEFHKTKYTELKEAADAGSVFAKKIIDEIHKVLTIEDAAPTLNIKEPKVKK